MHKSAYDDVARFVANHLDDTPLVIAEIGSRDVNGSIRPLFANPKWRYTGYDIVPGEGVDVVLTGDYYWPEVVMWSCDVIVSTQTIEHVRKPWLWFETVEKKLDHCGLLYVCAPHTHPYHEHPVDCWRIWPEGMIAMAMWVGLKVMECYATYYDIGGREYGDTTLIARKV